MIAYVLAGYGLLAHFCCSVGLVLPLGASQTVGRLFNRIGYGVALPKDSPFLEVFSSEVLRMRGGLYRRVGLCAVRAVLLLLVASSWLCSEVD